MAAETYTNTFKHATLKTYYKKLGGEPGTLSKGQLIEALEGVQGSSVGDLHRRIKRQEDGLTGAKTDMYLRKYLDSRPDHVRTWIEQPPDASNPDIPSPDLPSPDPPPHGVLGSLATGLGAAFTAAIQSTNPGLFQDLEDADEIATTANKAANMIIAAAEVAEKDDSVTAEDTDAGLSYLRDQYLKDELQGDPSELLAVNQSITEVVDDKATKEIAETTAQIQQLAADTAASAASIAQTPATPGSAPFQAAASPIQPATSDPFSTPQQQASVSGSSPTVPTAPTQAIAPGAVVPTFSELESAVAAAGQNVQQHLQQSPAQGSPAQSAPPGSPPAVTHPDASTVVNTAALLSRQEQMEQLALEIGKQTAQSHKQTRGAIDKAAMGLIQSRKDLDDKKQARKFLSENTGEAAKQLETIDALAQQNPRAAKVYERGLITLQQMQDKTYVEALEKSLQAKEQRQGDVKFGAARRAQPGQYARVVRQSDGIGRDRQPRFDTSPYYTSTAR